MISREGWLPFGLLVLATCMILESVSCFPAIDHRGCSAEADFPKKSKIAGFQTMLQFLLYYCSEDLQKFGDRDKYSNF